MCVFAGHFLPSSGASDVIRRAAGAMSFERHGMEDRMVSSDVYAVVACCLPQV